MASSSRLTVDNIARYCAGEELSDCELEAELDQIEPESDEEGLEARITDDEEEYRVQNLLDVAYSQFSSATDTPAERDSLLFLDPDMSKCSYWLTYWLTQLDS